MAHHLGKQSAGGGRRICNGVGAGLDSAENIPIRGAAGGDDGHVGKAASDRGDDLRGTARAGHVENIGACRQPASDVHVRGDDGGDNRDIHYVFDLRNGFIGEGGVDHHAEGTLVFCILGQADGSGTVCHPTAHAHKDRDVSHTDNCLTDGGLGRKGVDRDNSIRVDVFDNRYIRGKNQRLDAAAKDADAAALVDAVGDIQQVAAGTQKLTQLEQVTVSQAESEIDAMLEQEKKEEEYHERTLQGAYAQ